MDCPPILIKIRQIVARGEELLLAFLLSAMILLACVQIALRDLFSSGLPWADPLLRYMVLWTGLLGAAVATRQGKHISIDIISHLVPEKYLSWLAIIINLSAAVVCTGLTYAALLFIQSEYLYGGSRVLLGIPSWGMNLIFPFVFALMTVRFLIIAAGTVRTMLHLKPCMPAASVDKK